MGENCDQTTIKDIDTHYINMKHEADNNQQLRGTYPYALTHKYRHACLAHPVLFLNYCNMQQYQTHNNKYHVL